MNMNVQNHLTLCGFAFFFNCMPILCFLERKSIIQQTDFHRNTHLSFYAYILCVCWFPVCEHIIRSVNSEHWFNKTCLVLVWFNYCEQKLLRSCCFHVILWSNTKMRRIHLFIIKTPRVLKSWRLWQMYSTYYII